MKSFFIIVLWIVILLLSCKKDQENYEIIYPGSYFPVYPNSWWVYKDQDDALTTHSVDQAYRLNKYITWAEDNKTEYSDPCYVPFYDGQPIYGYYKIDKGSAYPFVSCNTKWPILSEQTGFTFEKKWVDHRYTDAYEMVRVKGKYFNGKDSILVQEVYISPAHYTDIITTQEWAKNIGLILQYSTDTITGVTFSRSWLIDYYVSFDSTSVDW
jgi:hypothetical protein